MYRSACERCAGSRPTAPIALIAKMVEENAGDL